MASKGKKGGSKSSAPKPKQELKDISLDDMKDDELQALEREGSFAWQVLKNSTIKQLKTVSPDDLMTEIAEILGLTDWQSDWRSGAILDCYVISFFWAANKLFDSRQISTFFTLVSKILDQIKGGASLFDTTNYLLETFSTQMPPPNSQPIDNKNSTEEPPPKPTSAVDCLTPEQAKSATEFISNTILQHFSLYQYAYFNEQVEEVTSTEYCISVLPRSSLPFPAPLEEAVTEDVYNSCILTPPPSPEPEGVDESEVAESDSDAGIFDTNEKEDEILSELTVDQIRSIVNKLAAREIGTFQEEYHSKLKERETTYLAKITKLAKNVEI